MPQKNKHHWMYLLFRSLESPFHTSGFEEKKKKEKKNRFSNLPRGFHFFILHPSAEWHFKGDCLNNVIKIESGVENSKAKIGIGGWVKST
jgi:hypothetical protein